MHSGMLRRMEHDPSLVHFEEGAIRRGVASHPPAEVAEGGQSQRCAVGNLGKL